jgi:integrase/recombinase XerD
MPNAHPPYSRSLPVAEWPQVDQARWQLALQPSDPLNDSIGFAGRWKTSTCKLVEVGYGHWLTWLTRSGQLNATADPADRASRERVAAYRHAMEEAGLAPYTVAGRLQQLGDILRAIAPDYDWIWVTRGASRLQSRAAPVHDKGDGMRAANDVLKLGVDLMHAAEHDRFRTRIDRAVLFRDGLLIAMLVSRPMRRANITGIEIGVQLQRRGDHWWLAFESTQMKSNRRFDCSLPQELTPKIDRYIEVYRPVLVGCARRALKPSNALWMSKQGTPMTACAVAVQVSARTEEEFGKPINPHMFRRIYATDIATMNPAHAVDIRLGLGHTTMKTSEQYYNMAKMVDAGDKHQATVAELRKVGGLKRDNRQREVEC